MGDATKDLYIMILLLGVLFFAWWYTGGPDRESARKGPFINPPAPLGTGDIYGDAQFRQGNTDEGAPVGGSASKDIIEISSAIGAKETAGKEYIELRAPYTNKRAVDMTDWRIGNSLGLAVSVGRAAKLPQSGTAQGTDSLILAPGDRAIVFVGRSPIGVSFQENICTGYFEQFNDFTPALTKSCPNPADEYEKIYGGMSQACDAYLSDIDRCTTVVRTETPSGVESSCIDFARNEVSYSSCVSKHIADKNFYKPSWRVFLGRTDELWPGDFGLILLYNAEGGLIDSERYR